MAEADIICERRGAAGFVLLNRPQALNALNHAMVEGLDAALTRWEHDPAIERVVIAGAGERAFCAGGDIRLMHDLGRAGRHDEQLSFWRDEYRLNRRIARYGKPFVALMDGFVMGGGVGVSIHGSHRVAGDKLAFAMPEVSIGFFPDVGATYFLPRLPDAMGAYLAVTGARVGAGDGVALGLATSYTPSSRFGALAQGLEARGDTAAIIAGFAETPPAGKLLDQRDLIRAAFGPCEIAAMVRELEQAQAGGSAFAGETLALLRAKSPTSVAIGLRQMAVGASLEIEEALRVEFRIVSRICRMADFYEGVRAVIIDKDNRPVWQPARLEDVDPAALDACFASLGPDELHFEREGGTC
jgi:enoyl-CoA hydratase